MLKKKVSINNKPVDYTKYIMPCIFSLMMTHTFHNTIRKYIDNNIFLYTLDFLGFIFFCSLSYIFSGSIFILILIFILSGFIIFIYYDIYRFKDCSNNNDIVIYPFLILSLYFYINQYIKDNGNLIINKLADCTYSSISKMLMFFCIMLSLSYRSINMFICCSLLFIYMLST